MIFLKKTIRLLLGEEELQFNIGSNIPNDDYFVDTGFGSGYKIIRRGLTLIVRRISKLAFLSGLPPLYYFKGSKEEDSNLIVGKLQMLSFPRCFILLWCAIVFVILILGVVLTSIRALEYMMEPSEFLLGQLQSTVSIVGAAIFTGLFGALIVGIVRRIARKHKQELKQFCNNLE